VEFPVERLHPWGCPIVEKIGRHFAKQIPHFGLESLHDILRERFVIRRQIDDGIVGSCTKKVRTIDLAFIDIWVSGHQYRQRPDRGRCVLGIRIDDQARAGQGTFAPRGVCFLMRKTSARAITGSRA
jgi:hypothetical protein